MCHAGSDCANGAKEARRSCRKRKRNVAKNNRCTDSITQQLIVAQFEYCARINCRMYEDVECAQSVRYQRVSLYCLYVMVPSAV